jgi:hypothetical protein
VLVREERTKIAAFASEQTFERRRKGRRRTSTAQPPSSPSTKYRLCVTGSSASSFRTPVKAVRASTFEGSAVSPVRRGTNQRVHFRFW